jgi:epoxyqueuosine reductase
LAGITDASPIDPDHAERLADWLKAGYAGQMKYMHRNFVKRTNPAKLLENAQSVIVVGLNYKPPKRPAAEQTGRIANYAQYEDYHLFIKKLLRKLTDFISSIVGVGFEFKICVDSAPLAERALAARAGLGFIGKNHTLINPTLGPQILLGEIITNLKLQPDEPTENRCSNCDKCIIACPAGVLRPDGQFDANRCISYLTIEYNGQIPPELTEKIGNRLFGCDECVLACPYHKDAPVCGNKQFKFYENRVGFNLQEVLNMSSEDFEREFADSAIRRSGLERLKRNAEICLDNISAHPV